MGTRPRKLKPADRETGAFGMRMDFYVHRDLEGNFHVQNSVMGLSGQHHVHSRTGYQKWKADVAKSCLHEELAARPCTCGLGPGDTREYDGHVWHQEE